MVKKLILALVLVFVLVSSTLGCSKPAASPLSSPSETNSPEPSTKTKSTLSSTPSSTPSKSGPSQTPTTITTPLVRPAAGKSQELTFTLKTPGDIYNLVIYLANGETLDLDWKFVANPQVGIEFMFTTPDGREMDARSQPINLPGHPLYDPEIPSQNIEDAVGSNVVVKVSRNSYCHEGYYSMVFMGSSLQSGTLYIRYDLVQPAN
jgi:hypothetical protein